MLENPAGAIDGDAADLTTGRGFVFELAGKFGRCDRRRFGYGAFSGEGERGRERGRESAGLREKTFFFGFVGCHTDVLRIDAGGRANGTGEWNMEHGTWQIGRLPSTFRYDCVFTMSVISTLVWFPLGATRL